MHHERKSSHNFNRIHLDLKDSIPSGNFVKMWIFFAVSDMRALIWEKCLSGKFELLPISHQASFQIITVLFCNQVITNVVHVPSFNPNPPPPPTPAILAKNLPESTEIQHHAVTLPPNCWTLLKLGHPAPCKVSLSGYTVPSPSKYNKPSCWSLTGLEVVRVKKLKLWRQETQTINHLSSYFNL